MPRGQGKAAGGGNDKRTGSGAPASRRKLRRAGRLVSSGGGLAAAVSVIAGQLVGRPGGGLPIALAAVVVVIGMALTYAAPFLAGLVAVGGLNERLKMLRAVRRRFEAAMDDDGDSSEKWREAERLVKLSNDLRHDLEH